MGYTFDTKGQTANTAANPTTLSYTPGAGSSLLCVGLIYAGITARTGGAPTYNGVALQAGSVQSTGGSTCTVETWYMLSPPTQVAHNISVPNTNTRTMTLIAASFTVQASFLPSWFASNPATNTSANPSQTISTPNDAVIFQVCGDANALTAGQTSLFTGAVGTAQYGGQYKLQASGTTATMNWTAASGRWATAAMSFGQTMTGTSYVLMMMGYGL